MAADRPNVAARMAAALGGPLAWITLPSQAALPVDPAPAAAGYLTELLGGLLLVLALILALAWVLRRMPGGVGPGQQMIEVLAVRAIGTRERLMLIQVGEEQILVGVAPSGMRHLHTLNQPITIAQREPGAGDFAGLLSRVRSKGREK